MQDILREAQTRLREFTETMQRLTGGPDPAESGGQNLRESNEVILCQWTLLTTMFRSLHVLRFTTEAEYVFMSANLEALERISVAYKF